MTTTQATVEASETWIYDYARDEIHCDHEALMAAAAQSLESFCRREWLMDFEGVRLDREFWDHFEVVTGREVPEFERGNLFP